MVPLKVKSILESVGITNCIELDWWESKNIYLHSSSSSSQQSSIDKNITITCLPAKHWSARTLFDKNATLWASFAISSKRGNYYFGGDTGYCPNLFSNIGKYLDGRIDLALIPIGAYKPKKIQGEVHCDPAEAVQIHLDLNAKRSLGIHWGTFDLAHDAGCEAAFELHRCRTYTGLTSNDMFTMTPGECLYVDDCGEEAVSDISRLYPQQLQRYLDLNPASRGRSVATRTVTTTPALETI